MEPIQFDNNEGKQQKEIPYMIINLDYNDEVYIGKKYPHRLHRERIRRV